MTQTVVRYGADSVDSLIRSVRRQRVILDSDLARIYGVTTKRLNEQVRRNKVRFPEDFVFRLTRDEFAEVQPQPLHNQHVDGDRSQIATGSSKHRDPRFSPYAFTEHGAIMAATVLNSQQAIQMSVFVVRAFVSMRRMLVDRSELTNKLAELDKKLTARLDNHESGITEVLQQIMLLLNPPPEPEPEPKRIGFHVREHRAVYRVKRAVR